MTNTINQLFRNRPWFLPGKTHEGYYGKAKLSIDYLRKKRAYDRLRTFLSNYYDYYYTVFNYFICLCVDVATPQNYPSSSLSRAVPNKFRTNKTRETKFTTHAIIQTANSREPSLCLRMRAGVAKQLHAISMKPRTRPVLLCRVPGIQSSQIKTDSDILVKRMRNRSRWNSRTRTATVRAVRSISHCFLLLLSPLLVSRSSSNSKFDDDTRRWWTITIKFTNDICDVHWICRSNTNINSKHQYYWW